ncbi:hypothetical protein ACQP2F_12980 [Actinoplanes sp. CA-030573]|uniref:hypothetical protein n=1 Tax=Actinoplanes sp. CA-030573 TaxID=3239898 RepID=UPI003D923D9D
MDSWEAILLVIATIGSVAAAAGAWVQERRGTALQLAKQAVDRIAAARGIGGR